MHRHLCFFCGVPVACADLEDRGINCEEQEEYACRDCRWVQDKRPEVEKPCPTQS